VPEHSTKLCLGAFCRPYPTRKDTNKDFGLQPMSPYPVKSYWPVVAVFQLTEGLQRPAKTVVAKKRKNLATIEYHPSELWGYFSDFLIRRVRVFEPSCGSASLCTQSLRAPFFLPQPCVVAAAVAD